MDRERNSSQKLIAKIKRNKSMIHFYSGQSETRNYSKIVLSNRPVTDIKLSPKTEKTSPKDNLFTPFNTKVIKRPNLKLLKIDLKPSVPRSIKRNIHQEFKLPESWKDSKPQMQQETLIADISCRSKDSKTERIQLLVKAIKQNTLNQDAVFRRRIS